jgi:hypothetical protein
MVVEKKKPCPVCTYLKVYSPEFVIEVNNLIFSKGKEKQVLDLLVTSKILNNMVKPTGHFIEKHRKNCLIGFIAKVDDNKIIPEDKNCLVNTSLQSFLDEYEKMTVQERDNEHIERLKKIKYLSGVIILQQLFNNKHERSIPKDDISSLKQIEDIVHSLKLDNKLPDLNINIKDIGEDIE